MLRPRDAEPGGSQRCAAGCAQSTQAWEGFCAGTISLLGKVLVWFFYKNLNPRTFSVKGTKGETFQDKTISSGKAFALLWKLETWYNRREHTCWGVTGQRGEGENIHFKIATSRYVSITSGCVTKASSRPVNVGSCRGWTEWVLEWTTLLRSVCASSGWVWHRTTVSVPPHSSCGSAAHPSRDGPAGQEAELSQGCPAAAPGRLLRPAQHHCSPAAPSEAKRCWGR